MSVQIPEYVTEALGLLTGEPSAEIQSPHQVTERKDGRLVEVERSAFVKLFTSFKKELKTIDGDALKIWIYLALSVNRHTKTASPGLRRIAEDCGMSVNTVRKHVESLDTAGLLESEKEDGKSTSYRPADYVSVSKFDTPTVSKNDGTVSKNEPTVSRSRREFAQLEELESTRDPFETLLQFEKSKQGHEAESWTGRDIFLAHHMPLVDWYHNTTGQDCPKAKQKDWMRAVGDWYANNLTVQDLQAAYDIDITWRKVFTSPSQLTDKAVALKAQKKSQPKKDTLRMLIS